ncbi:hypothetical protein [Mesorhizobium sp. CN2-181]|uniref:hypothetical protein n=1 Tax=Mesorhizobium yinganensis TaxID=3157707 RepID=UPI0032B825A3
MRYHTVIFPILLGLASPAAAHSDADEIISPVSFDLDVNGSVVLKTIKELGTKEAGILITAGCAAFSVDCSRQAAAGVMIAKKVYPTFSGDHGRGDEHQIDVNGPAGYTSCDVTVSNNGISDESTFSAKVVRGGVEGLSTYFVVPPRRQNQFVHVTITVRWMPIGRIAQHPECLKSHETFINCKGTACNP